MKTQSDPDFFLQLLSDEPIDSDNGLGLESWAKIIAGVALKTKGPFTIGIFGGWGTGKTSMLQLAKTIIDKFVKEKKSIGITTVSFNAWQYEKEENPLVSLIASILKELKSENLSDKFKENSNKLLDAMHSITYSFSTQIKGNTIEHHEKLHNALKTLKDVQCEDLIHRVIIFIDNLDQCFPDKAILLLESIKLLLSQPGFIFVLAINRQLLENHFEKFYKDNFGLKEEYNQGRLYLDQFIQLPLWIPPHEKRFKNFIEKLLDDPALNKHKDAFKPLIDVICLACDHNPRQLKRFLNNILVDQRVYFYLNSREKTFPLEAFIIARGFHHQSESIYYWLCKNENNELCNELANCKYKGIKKKLEKRLNTTKAEDISQKRLKELLGRDSLLQLLSTNAGQKWLSNKNLRDNVDNFLSEERELDQWIQEQVQRAWRQLFSDIEEDILTACHTLTAFSLPASMHSKICQKLKELTKNSKSSISQEADYTYNYICGHSEN
ncbi:MAG: P-loop NTPase fold protein [Candidatus Competibacteraceae bacterium]